MKRIELLIKEIREQTENSDYNSTLGIQQSEFIRYLNSAQESLQSAICQQIQKIFLAEKDIDIIAYQDTYNLPDDIFIGNRVHAVWFSRTGQKKDLKLLDPINIEERCFYPGFYPYGYIRDSGKIILCPPPTISVTNGLKICYVKQLPSLDIRRAKIQAVTTSGTTITSLTLDLSAFLDDQSLIENYQASVVDRFGHQKMKALPIVNINKTTGEVTLDSFNFNSSESVSAGDFLVCGRDAANVSSLPDFCEDFLINYAVLRILRRDSSVDSQAQEIEVQKAMSDILNLFGNIDENQKFVTIIDFERFNDY